MIYKAVDVIWIFSAGGRDGRAGIEGTIRGPRGPKKVTSFDFQIFFPQHLVWGTLVHTGDDTLPILKRNSLFGSRSFDIMKRKLFCVGDKPAELGTTQARSQLAEGNLSS